MNEEPVCRAVGGASRHTEATEAARAQQRWAPHCACHSHTGAKGRERKEPSKRPVRTEAMETGLPQRTHTGIRPLPAEAAPSREGAAKKCPDPCLLQLELLLPSTKASRKPASGGGTECRL